MFPVIFSVKFRFVELSISRICAESRDLGPDHGFRACSFENKGNKIGFSYFGGQKNKKKLEHNDEIGQMLLSGAIDDTKRSGRPPRIFSRILELKNLEKPEQSRCSPDFSPIFLWM